MGREGSSFSIRPHKRKNKLQSKTKKINEKKKEKCKNISIDNNSALNVKLRCSSTAMNDKISKN